MALNKKTDYGIINISNKAIASVIADAALECYGVVGITKKDSIKDKISVLLKRGQYIDGVTLTNDKKGITISIYIAVAYGIKITEVLREVQKKVKYVTEKTFQIKVLQTNVFVQDLKKVE